MKHVDTKSNDNIGKGRNVSFFEKFLPFKLSQSPSLPATSNNNNNNNNNLSALGSTEASISVVAPSSSFYEEKYLPNTYANGGSGKGLYQSSTPSEEPHSSYMGGAGSGKGLYPSSIPSEDHSTQHSAYLSSGPGSGKGLHPSSVAAEDSLNNYMLSGSGKSLGYEPRLDDRYDHADAAGRGGSGGGGGGSSKSFQGSSKSYIRGEDEVRAQQQQQQVLRFNSIFFPIVPFS